MKQHKPNIYQLQPKLPFWQQRIHEGPFWAAMQGGTAILASWIQGPGPIKHSLVRGKVLWQSLGLIFSAWQFWAAIAGISVAPSTAQPSQTSGSAKVTAAMQAKIMAVFMMMSLSLV